MAFNYCTSGAIVTKAGSNVSSTAIASSAIMQQFSNEAEAFINVMTRHDWATAPLPSTNYLGILSEVASDLAATMLIAYDMSGYTARGEAEDMINILYDRAMKGIKMLADYKTKETLGVN